MRVGIDCRTILDEHAREKAGVAHYTYYLVKTLLNLDRDNHYVLFFDHRASSVILNEVKDLGGGSVEIQFFRFARYKRFLPYIYSHILIANQIQKAKLDVYHSPANIVPLSLLKSAARPKIVVTVHDLAIYRHPEWFPKGQGFSIKYLVPQTVKLVDRIIVPSQATKKDLVELFTVPESKIAVIPHGVEERFFKQTTPSITTNYQLLTTNYILFVGTLEPRKNLNRLLEAYLALPEDTRQTHHLVLVGQKGWGYQKLFARVQNLPPSDRERVKILGYYPGSDLPALFQAASVFVYPSLYEGFGLPVLEAMAAGCPVVTSNLSSLPELVGRGDKEANAAGLLVDPYAVGEMTKAIAKLVRDFAYARQISERGRKRAREFTWRKMAEKTLSVYQGSFPKISVISALT